MTNPRTGGTNRKVEDIMKKKVPDGQFDMASNPTVRREGSALEDFRRPDRAAVGCDTDRAREVLREVSMIP
jgi:UDPglucose 6-dehydrogenase